MGKLVSIMGRDGDEAFEQRLLDALQASGALGAEAAERAWRAFERSDAGLVDILIRLALCDERILAQQIAAISGLPLLEPASLPQAPIRRDAISVPFLHEARLLPVEERGDHVVVAGVDPSSTYSARAMSLAFGKPVAFVVATPSQIEDGLQTLYGGVHGDGLASPAGDVTDTDLARLRESAGEAPIIRFVDRLIARAVDAGASDIHLEPMERRLRVRLRVDGMLADEEPAPLSSALAIVSRLKILARLDIAERRLPQDGSIKLNLRGREVDFRVATIPSAHGETVVIRILDRETVRLDLAALGMGGPRTESLSRLLERPNGILLVTGPTGSGKSTTLYAALNRLNTAQRKIVTVEDPIEFKIDGLNQVQVKPDIGMDFARSLRAILRHDPDIVMVGEIRDGETARVAMQAALTGHLVLSTLHTNDAASASPRLLDMGIEPYLIASTLSAVLAQRLVRTLCPYCRQACDVPAAIAEQAAWRRQQGLEVVAFEPSGCAECRGTGYRGRIAISELLTVDDVVRKAILSRSDAAQLKAVAVDRGMETLYRNGVDAVLSGVTAYDEVLRVAQDCGT